MIRWLLIRLNKWFLNMRLSRYLSAWGTANNFHPCSDKENRWRRSGVFPATIFLFKSNNRNTRERCEICSKLINTRTTFIVNFEHISQLFLEFLLLTLKKWLLGVFTAGFNHFSQLFSVLDFKQINICRQFGLTLFCAGKRKWISNNGFTA